MIDRIMEKNMEIQKKKYIQSERHQKALEYALNKIQSSVIFPYINEIILYGSCAKKTEKYNSDVDLFVEFQEKIKSNDDYKYAMLLLKSEVSMDDIYDPEVDLKIAFGNDWRQSAMSFYKAVKRDGIRLYP